MTLWTSTRAPARNATFASARPVAWTISGSPALRASSPAASTAGVDVSTARSGRTMYQTFTAWAPIDFKYATPVRADSASFNSMN